MRSYNFLVESPDIKDFVHRFRAMGDQRSMKEEKASILQGKSILLLRLSMYHLTRNPVTKKGRWLFVGLFAFSVDGVVECYVER
jgi:hypothetical protein